MPLDESGSKASIGKNISTEMNAGKKKSQAVAIGLNVARQKGAHIAKSPKAPHLGMNAKPTLKLNKPAPMLGVYKKKM